MRAFGGQGLCHSRIDVKNRQGVAIVQQALGHGRAHGAQANKAHMLAHLLSPEVDQLFLKCSEYQMTWATAVACAVMRQETD